MAIKTARETDTLGQARCGNKCLPGSNIEARIIRPTTATAHRRNMVHDNNTDPNTKHQVTKPEMARIDETQRYTYAQNS